MERQQDVLALIDNYLQTYAGEAERLTAFRTFVQRYDGDDLYTRHNHEGHLTASAFIVDRQGQNVLLLQHKALGRWLQPGGHIDSADAGIAAAALREALEETGIGAEALVPLTDRVLDLDSHLIPANAKKNEPSHYHHDVRYLFRCLRAGGAVTFDATESTGARWVPLDELEQMADFVLVADKIRSMQ